MEFTQSIQPVIKTVFAPLPLRWLPLAGLIGFMAIFWRHQELVNLQWDFGAYYVAGKALSMGGNPYGPEDLKQAGALIDGADYHGLLFLYSPLFLRILAPLFSLDLFTAAFIWYALKCAVLEMVLFITLQLMRVPISIAALVLMNIAAVTFHPFGLDFSSGNVAIFEGTLLLAGLLALSKDRQTLAAFFITCGSFMKISPFLLALYPLHRREKRFLYSLVLCLAGLAAIAAIDWRMTENYIAFTHSEAVVYHWDEQVQSVYNISLTSLILRTFAHTYFCQPLIDAPWLVPVLTPLAPAVIFILLAFSIKKHESNAQDPNSPLIYCALLLAVLLIPPRLTGYTLSWTIFPCIYLVVHSWKQRDWRAFVLSIVGVFLLQWYFAPSQIKPGFEQLLIDSELFGLIALFLSACLQLCNRPHPKKSVIH